MKIGSKNLVQLTAAALLVAASSSLRADTIVWDPDGAGSAPKVNMNTFQFGAGNSLSRTAIPFTLGNTFQLLFQAQLNSVVTNTGAQIVPVGLNASGAVGGVAPYEITVVGSVTEQVTNVNTQEPARVAFHLSNPQAANSFIEIYFDGSQNANPLQGTGYNDGTLILKGTPVVASPNAGTFSLTKPTPTPAPAFDSFANNDYTGVTSILGIGATRLDVVVTAVDSSFFVAAAQGDAGRQVHVGDIVSIDLSQSAPFDKIDPSKKFTTVANSGTGSGPTPTATPIIGSQNGTGGFDLQAQTLIAASIRSSSPTPTPSTTPTPTATASPSVTPTPTATASPTPPPGSIRVAVSASPTSITEGQDSTITFSVKPTGTPHPDLTVNYSVAGNATLNTDYTLTGTGGQVPIPSGQSSATITLHAITDTVKEPNGEIAKITVTAGTGYIPSQQPTAVSAKVFIADPSPTP